MPGSARQVCRIRQANRVVEAITGTAPPAGTPGAASRRTTDSEQIVAIDANFGLVGKTSSGVSSAPPLQGTTMFLDDNEVKEFLNEYSDEGKPPEMPWMSKQLLNMQVPDTISHAPRRITDRQHFKGYGLKLAQFWRGAIDPATPSTTTRGARYPATSDTVPQAHPDTDTGSDDEQPKHDMAPEDEQAHSGTESDVEVVYVGRRRNARMHTGKR
uniref:Uncharacterized protein n=1 Tax=Branchiostoma floridae TaxID=7739 RepID=C3ZZB1_BRAFL|eukprot:XP_002586104.1 hypothetical protein BRAFLDRAFT_110006 [Branchiostoma floridae]